MRSRSSGVSIGDGHSSMIFWLRRCIEQSRSPRCMHVAVRVGQDLELDVVRVHDEFLDVTIAVAKAALASPLAARKQVDEVAPPCRTGRMPRPPPPAVALTITGKPIARAHLAKASSSSWMSRRNPA